MAGHNGRQLTIDYASTTLVGVRSKTVSVSNDHVDVTTDDDGGWRTLLADPGLRSLEITISGVTSDEVMLAAMMAADVTGGTVDANLPSGLASPGSLSGTFFISSHEVTGEHDGSCDFSTTFMSSGEVTYTASSA